MNKFIYCYYYRIIVLFTDFLSLSCCFVIIVTIFICCFHHLLICHHYWSLCVKFWGVEPRYSSGKKALFGTGWLSIVMWQKKQPFRNLGFSKWFTDLKHLRHCMLMTPAGQNCECNKKIHFFFRLRTPDGLIYTQLLERSQTFSDAQTQCIKSWRV